MRLLLATMIAITALDARGQQLSQYTQYVFNQFSVNPAVAGSKDCIDLRLGYRQQWTGFEGAPTTGWASIHAAIKPKGKPAVGNKHGVGAFMEADNAGNWGYTRMLLAYAYHVQMSRDYFMSFGLFGGVVQEKFDLGNVFAVNYNDPALDNRASVVVFPEITPGLFVYNKVAWGGLAMHQVLGNKIEGIGLDSRLARHFMLSGGYKYRIGRETSFTPSLLMKFAGGAPMALDLNAMVEWKRTIGLGMGYRNGDAVTFLMKVAFFKYFQVGYSYDVTTSKLRVAGNNTHEFILGITPCGKEDLRRKMINCPAFE
jgi:type IX secretion system PorP/SprF family membrane protein